MKISFSLKKQFVLVAGIYTIVLLAAVFLLLSVSGERRIGREAKSDISLHISTLRQNLDREIAGTLAELYGLQSRLDYRLSTGQSGRDLSAIQISTLKEFLTGYHRKYAGIIISHAETEKTIRLEPIREFSVIDVRLETARFLNSRGLTGMTEDSIRVDGPVLGKFGWELHFRIPLNWKNNAFFDAVIHLNHLFDVSIDQNLWPESLHFFLVDHSNTVLYSEESTFRNMSITAAGISPPDSEDPESSLQYTLQNTAVTGWQKWQLFDLCLVMHRDYQDELNVWHSENMRLLAYMFGVSVVAMLLIWVLANQISRSIGQVAQVAHEVADGDYSKKLSVRRNDELGVLFHAFNNMTSRLEEKIKELSDARKVLSQKQRLALVGEAMSKVSHEIQNKIGGVSIWVQNLDRYLEKDKNAQVYIVELRQALNSFMETMVHFKRFYRAPALQIESVEPAKFFEETIERVKSDAEAKDVSIVLSIKRELPVVALDVKTMQDALVNVLLNAIYFSPEEGKINLSCALSENKLLISILDEGPGIQGDIEQLFQPFYTTRESGSGLGLAIVKNIVIAHGGHIFCENRPPAGACVTIELPIDVESN